MDLEHHDFSKLHVAVNREPLYDAEQYRDPDADHPYISQRPRLHAAPPLFPESTPVSITLIPNSDHQTCC